MSGKPSVWTYIQCSSDLTNDLYFTSYVLNKYNKLLKGGFIRITHRNLKVMQKLF